MRPRQIASQNLIISVYNTLRKLNKEKVSSDKYFNRVYLCYEETNNKTPTTYGQIVGFNCHKYKSFQDADNRIFKHRKELHTLNIRHTIIPICKWVPEVFDKYILHWKLEKLYWLGGIYIRTIP